MTHSPTPDLHNRGAGKGRQTIIWGEKKPGSEQRFNLSNFCFDGNNWNALANAVQTFCNGFIAPHQLTSISIFEEDSPNGANGRAPKIHASITHTGGDELKPLDYYNTTSILPKEGIYTVKLFPGTEWNDLFKQACEYINSIGGEEGHLVSSTEDSR